MKKNIHRANSRGFADQGWLKSYHTFSFAEYHNPERVHFGKIRVLNDDWINPNSGFGTHPHDNMEIITILLQGSIWHKDSMGNEYVISPGEIQRMSAGTGITHSEYNKSSTEITNLLQIWVFPKEKNIKPSYQQKSFVSFTEKNKFQTIISPDGQNHSLTINQDAYFSIINLEKNTRISYPQKKAENGVYFFVIQGAILLADESLESRDAVGLWEINNTELSLSATQDAQVLVIETPLH